MQAHATGVTDGPGCENMRTQVGIYKRKQESKKTRKQELDQKSDQENKKTRTQPRKRPKNKNSTKKAIKKTRKIFFFFITFLFKFLFSYFLVFFHKFPPQSEGSGRLQEMPVQLKTYPLQYHSNHRSNHLLRDKGLTNL